MAVSVQLVSQAEDLLRKTRAEVRSLIEDKIRRRQWVFLLLPGLLGVLLHEITARPAYSGLFRLVCVIANGVFPPRGEAGVRYAGDPNWPIAWGDKGL
jgi:hypothetical protein